MFYRIYKFVAIHKMIQLGLSIDVDDEDLEHLDDEELPPLDDEEDTNEENSMESID